MKRISNKELERIRVGIEAVRLARLAALFFAGQHAFNGDWFGVLVMFAMTGLLHFALPVTR